MLGGLYQTAVVDFAERGCGGGAMSLMDVGCSVVAVAFGWLFWRRQFFGFALDLGFEAATMRESLAGLWVSLSNTGLCHRMGISMTIIAGLQ